MPKRSKVMIQRGNALVLQVTDLCMGLQIRLARALIVETHLTIATGSKHADYDGSDRNTTNGCHLKEAKVHREL
jgi:hypothetical protein